MPSSAPAGSPQQAFLPGVVQSGNSRVAAIVTGDRAKAARLADFYGIGAVVGYDGYDTLLASPTIDAVYIALPNHMHADFAIRAARAGKHVMVEKPLAVSEDEALAMIAAARAANVFLMTAYRLHQRAGNRRRSRSTSALTPSAGRCSFSLCSASRRRWESSVESIDLGWAASGCRCLLHQRRPSHLCGRADRGDGDVVPAGRRPALWRYRRLGGRDVAIPLGRPRAIRRQLRGSGGRQLPGRGNVGRPGTRPWIQIRHCDHGCGCAMTERSSRPSFRRSTILARRSDISRIASDRERRPKQMATRG